MIKSALSNKKNLIMNVGSGKSVTVNKIVKLLSSKSITIPKGLESQTKLLLY